MAAKPTSSKTPTLSKTPTSSKTLRITLRKSPIGFSKDQKQTIAALGLRKREQSVEHSESPTVRGMIKKVAHLVDVEEAS